MNARRRRPLSPTVAHLIAAAVAGLAGWIVAAGSGDGTRGWLVAFGGLLIATLAIVGTTEVRTARWARTLAERMARGDTLDTSEHGGPPGTQVVLEALASGMRDIGSRIATLQQAGDVRARILDAMPEAVLLLAGDAVVYANAAAASVLGAQAGRPLPAQVRPALTTPGDLVVRHPTYRELTTATVDLEDGTTMVVAQDVTDARRLDRMRRDFVANASHELKTPLAAIRATAETLTSALDDDPEAARRFATTLEREAARMSALVQDLLDLARLEQTTTTGERLSFSDVVEEVTARARGTAGAAEVAVHATVAPDVTVTGSRSDLAQLCQNLIANAITYTPAGGRIDVRLTSAGDRAILEVEDTGIGIPSKDLPRIFERFYRVDRARSRDTGGTGLGLSIVRHIAELHGGGVEAQSELGSGSTFIVRLPLAPRTTDRTPEPA